MPQPSRAHCRRCKKNRDEVGPISWGGNCRVCGAAALTENIVGLATFTGEPLARWRRGMAASVGAVILDNADRDPQSGERA